MTLPKLFSPLRFGPASSPMPVSRDRNMPASAASAPNLLTPLCIGPTSTASSQGPAVGAQHQQHQHSNRLLPLRSGPASAASAQTFCRPFALGRHQPRCHVARARQRASITSIIPDAFQPGSSPIAVAASAASYRDP